MQSFATRQELFLHKVSHMEDPRAYLPVQPHFDVEDERMNSLLRGNSELIFRHHHFTQVSADYNFPLTISLNQEGWIREVHHALDLVSNLNNSESFKLNISMGFILMHRETQEYRFFVPHNNNAFFKKPICIDRASSWREVYRQLDEESLIAYVTLHRENTKWIPLLLTNLSIQLYYMAVSMGAGELPTFIKTNHCIIGLDKNIKGKLYKDNLCGVRCLAFHLNHKETENGFGGLEVRTKELNQQWGQDGLDLLRVPEFEDTFNISVDIYSLCEDRSVIPRYLSEGLYQDKMVLNLWDSHLSYVSNIPAYLKKYRCVSCERHFDKIFNWKRHQGSCANATQYEFPGGFHKRTPTIFDRLKDFDIVVDIEQQQYPWFTVYDFEALLSPVNEKDQPTAQLRWMRRHEPISVSVASNVDGYETAKCFVNPDSKLLIKEMMKYMASIADRVRINAESKWSSAISDVEDLIEKYEAMLEKESNRKKRKTKTKNPKTSRKEQLGEWEGITEQEKQLLKEEWEHTLKKLYSLLGSLYHYCRQVPVLGFNSARYDLNLVKSHLIPWLRADVDPEEGEESVDINVIKKGSAYTQIGARRFKFLDISNYLAGGVSYSAFLKAYKIEEAKSYFPYEWFDDVSKLDFPHLPPYESFYSELKQKNVLEVQDKKDAEDEKEDHATDDKEVGMERYQELQHIWQQQDMTTFKDFLSYYNNLDVHPFVQAVEKMQQFYFAHDIDLFKVAVSVPGIAPRWLFQTANAANVNFALLDHRDDDLYYTIKQNIVGGPSIIFTRDAEVGRTFIRDDPTRPCSNIIGFDANALYLDCIDKSMPCGGYVRRTEPDFKPDSRLSCEDMFHWMNFIMKTEGIDILHARNHIGEVSIGPYLVDGYDPSTRTVYEFNGCYYHGCSVCKMDKDVIGLKRKQDTQTKEKYLRHKGYNMNVMWEHEFKTLRKTNPKLKQFIWDREPPFFRSHRWVTKESTLLKAVMDDTFFGFLEVDIHVPDHLYTYFEEMPPLFCNTDVQFEDMGGFMQQYVKDNKLSDKPRRLLISGMRAEKILLSSHYLKWLLQKGLVVSHIYQVVEFTPQRPFRKFVQEVSDARRSGDVNKDQKIIADTMKLIGNSGYGSLIMDKTKHQGIVYAQGRGAAQMKINEPCFKKCTLITDETYEIEMSKNKIRLNLPIQLGYHILQLAKLRMLQFRYDCLQNYCDVKDFEYLEMDTDSAYISTSAKTLEEIILPEKRKLLHHEKMGQCHDFHYTSEDGFFPRECCKEHKAYDKRTPGLFKVEAQGKAMIALCSKTYILKNHNDKVKFSSKGLNKASLIEPFQSYQQVLHTGQTKSFTNQGFQTHDNTIYTYQQTKGGLSYFYCKRKVMPDGVHTEPLDIILTPWPRREIEVVDENHPWSLVTEHEFIIEGKIYDATLAEVCLVASQRPDILECVLPQLPYHMPKGKVIFPLLDMLKKQDRWNHDTYWTTGLSPKSSPLRFNTPGQNKLGEKIEQFMRARLTEYNHLMDHDYL